MAQVGHVGDAGQVSGRRAWQRLAWATAVVLLSACATSPESPLSRPSPGVTVRTVEQTMAGVVVPLDVYAPAGPARGAVVLVHGFSRSRATMAGHAAALAEQGVLALAPDMPGGVDVTRSAQAIAALVRAVQDGDLSVPATPKVVLVGFSAGALATLLAADAPGVVGWIGLDPVDRADGGELGGPGRRAAARLSTEAWIVRAPPSRCNAQGSAAGWGALLLARVADERIDGASHCDFEAPSGPLCAWACGSPDPARQARVSKALREAVDRWLPRPAAPR